MRKYVNLSDISYFCCWSALTRLRYTNTRNPSQVTPVAHLEVFSILGPRCSRCGDVVCVQCAARDRRVPRQLRFCALSSSIDPVREKLDDPFEFPSNRWGEIEKLFYVRLCVRHLNLMKDGIKMRAAPMLFSFFSLERVCLYISDINLQFRAGILTCSPRSIRSFFVVVCL